MQTDTFYPQYYLNQYPDLQAAFGNTNYDAAVNHWRNHGMAEGRRPNPYFSAPDYLAKYPDLKTAFGATGYAAAAKHWIQSGIREGRDGNPKLATVAGRVFYDTDRDGVVDAGESFFPNVVVFVDRNGNDIREQNEVFDVTDKDGHYKLIDVPTNTNSRLKAELGSDWRASMPNASGIRNVTARPGDNLKQQSFGFWLSRAFAGRAYVDANANGRWESTESFLAKKDVFLDLNGNSRKDANEPVTKTDANGKFSFLAQPLGDFNVLPTRPVKGQTFAASTWGSTADASFENLAGTSESRPTGVGTSQLTYGQPANGSSGQSSLSFSLTPNFPAVAGEFTLGQLTFHNTVLTPGTAITSLDLSFVIDLGQASQASRFTIPRPELLSSRTPSQ